LTHDSSPRRKWAVLMIVALGTFMTSLDASIVNISLPSIARTFRMPIGGEVQWVIIAYLVVIAATLLTFGRLSDLLGRKPVWMAGLVMFTLGSIFCGAARSIEQLVVARAFQGLGGALIFAPSFAIIGEAFAADRGRALGLNAVIVAIGTSLGPTLGGLITEHLTWRWIFYLNVPLSVIALLASHHVLTSSRTRTREPLDIPGASLLAVGFACVTLALSFSQEWSGPRLLACLAVGIVALVGAGLVERRARYPIVDLALLRDRVLASALASMTLAMLALFAVSFMLPFYFEELRRLSIIESGVLLTPLPATIAAVAPFSGALADRIGSRWLSSGGLALACVGLLLLARLDGSSSIPDIVWRLVLTGVGQGLFQSPNARALMDAARPGQEGQASSLYATGRVVGQSLSVALTGAVFAGLGGAAAGRALAVAPTGSGSAARLGALEHTFLTGFHGALLVCAAVAAVGIIVVLVRGDERPVARTAGIGTERGMMSHSCGTPGASHPNRAPLSS
jgi:EmrB/QacA subfamily drug resistance transporter